MYKMMIFPEPVIMDPYKKNYQKRLKLQFWILY